MNTDLRPFFCLVMIGLVELVRADDAHDCRGAMARIQSPIGPGFYELGAGQPVKECPMNTDLRPFFRADDVPDCRGAMARIPLRGPGLYPADAVPDC